MSVRIVFFQAADGRRDAHKGREFRRVLFRSLLMMEAARRWDANWQECDTQDGFVLHQGKRLRFGELAAAAAQLTPPGQPVYRASSKLGRASCRARGCT